MGGPRLGPAPEAAAAAQLTAGTGAGRWRCGRDPARGAPEGRREEAAAVVAAERGPPGRWWWWWRRMRGWRAGASRGAGPRMRGEGAEVRGGLWRGGVGAETGGR